jgi:hypothetical protein
MADKHFLRILCSLSLTQLRQADSAFTSTEICSRKTRFKISFICCGENRMLDFTITVGKMAHGSGTFGSL